MSKSCLLLLVLASPVCVSGLTRKGDGEGLETLEDYTFDVVFDVALNGDSKENASFTVRVHPDWAPLGAAHFKKLVEQGWYNDAGVFRVVTGFVAQFGLPAKPQPEMEKIPDDKVKHSNARGTVTFATSGPNTRTSQLFINYGNNAFLDSQGFSTFGEVLGDGMAVADRFFSGYEEHPNQGRIKAEGNAYLDAFPKMTKLTKVSIKAEAEEQTAEPEAKEEAPTPSAGQAGLSAEPEAKEEAPAPSTVQAATDAAAAAVAPPAPTDTRGGAPSAASAEAEKVPDAIAANPPPVAPSGAPPSAAARWLLAGGLLWLL